MAYYFCPYCECELDSQEADYMDVCPVCGNAIEGSDEDEEGGWEI